MYALLVCTLQTCMKLYYNQFIHDFKVEMSTLLKFYKIKCVQILSSNHIGNKGNFL